MRCPQCQSENPAGNDHCYLCGAPLTRRAANPSSSQTFWKKASRQPKAAKSSPQDDMEGAWESQEELMQRRLRQFKEGDTVDINVPVSAPPKKNVNHSRLIVSCCLLVIVLAALGIGIWQAVKYINDASGRTAYEKALESQAQAPLVEKVLIDGSSWHKITFYGQDGERILITEPRRVLSLKNGFAELLLEDNSYIPDDPDPASEYVEVAIQATLFTETGEEKAIPVPIYQIEIPMTALTILSPTENSITTNENRIAVTLKVEPGSRVLIGNSNVTDRVNSQGIVTQYIDVTESTNLLISAEYANCRRNEYTLSINIAPMEVPIRLDSNLVTSTEDGAVHIYGTTEAGAVVSTDTELLDPVEMGDNGDFSFTAKLKLYGDNLINITSSTSDGRSTTIVFRVEREPNLDTYTRGAWALDYSQLLAIAEKQVGQVYLLKGKVTKKLESVMGNQYLFDVGTETGKLLVVEYDGSAGLTVDKYYRLYADVIGVQDGYPVLKARYVYDYSPATPTPEATATPEAE